MHRRGDSRRWNRFETSRSLPAEPGRLPRRSRTESKSAHDANHPADRRPEPWTEAPGRAIAAAALAASLVISLPAASHACLWDRDTLRDESTKHVDLTRIIVGRIPSHGEAYYRARITTIDPATDDLDSLNDLAVGQTRLAAFDEALGILEHARALDPSHYPTLSNLGVLHKKRGEFSKAAEFIRKALAVNPEGHMGLGNWYLRMLEWRRDHDRDAKVGVSFLGEPYPERAPLFHPGYLSETATAGAPARDVLDGSERLDRLEKLLVNDNHFSDGFLVLGDQLASRGDLNLAYLCYRRAERLGHPAVALLAARRQAIVDHHREAGLASGTRATVAAYDASADAAFAASDTWLTSLHATEAQTVAQGDSPTLEEVVEAAPQGRPLLEEGALGGREGFGATMRRLLGF